MTDDKVELSEEEINDMDDDDHDDDEEEEEEEIPENHSKLVAFHAAIKAVLERQLDKLQLEVNESRRLLDIGKKVWICYIKHIYWRTDLLKHKIIIWIF